MYTDYDYTELFSSLGSNFIPLALTVLFFVGLFKLFEKAGEPGWKAIIPFYNTYTLCKISKCTKLFFLKLVSDILGGISLAISLAYLLMYCIDSLSTHPEDNWFIVFLIVFAIACLFGLVSFITWIFISINLTKAFGVSGAVVFALIFARRLTIFILGIMDSVEYQYTDKTKSEPEYIFDEKHVSII